MSNNINQGSEKTKKPNKKSQKTKKKNERNNGQSGLLLKLLKSPLLNCNPSIMKKNESEEFVGRFHGVK